MEDPNTLYSDLTKIGEGASGSVYSAVQNVFFFFLYLGFRREKRKGEGLIHFLTLIKQATGKKLAIKQMVLCRQPKPDVLINEILLMKWFFFFFICLYY